MPGKSLIVLCDGTWSDLGHARRPPTNVAKLAQWIRPHGVGPCEHQPQIVHYVDGVGVSREAVAGRIERFVGGAFGAGLIRNLECAYRFLVLNFSPGDSVFLFGFSRGAFTARSLAGLINRVGILSPDQADQIGAAISFYKSKRSTRWRKPVAIAYIGVWETVGALGIPDMGLMPDAFGRRQHQFHDLNLSQSVRHARHALALNETRRAFSPTLWDNLGALRDQTGGDYQQRWFPGDHGSVGGGGEITGLSDGALSWIITGAHACGLGLDFKRMNLDADPMAPLSNAVRASKRRAGAKTVGRLSKGIMSALPKHRRDFSALNPSHLSDSAIARWIKDEDFRSSIDRGGLKLSTVRAALERQGRITE